MDFFKLKCQFQIYIYIYIKSDVLFPLESILAISVFKNFILLDFPSGTMVKNLPANAGDTGLTPGLGRSHMPWSNEACAPQLLSLCSRALVPQLLKPACSRACVPQLLVPCAATTEAHVPRARVHNKRSHHNEKPVHHNEE